MGKSFVRTLFYSLGALLLVSAPHSCAATRGQPVIAGKARFTVITPSLIRIEFSDHQKFIDAPSLFAVNRGTTGDDFRVVRAGNRLQIDTGEITLRYLNDGKPLSRDNLVAIIHGGTGDFTWTPEMKNARNLGGTLSNLDRIKGPVPVDEGLLARDGWHVIDDSNNFILVNQWVAQRPHDAGLDWYLFGYGDDYAQALRDLTAVGGAVPLPRRYVLGAWYSRWWPYSSDDYRRIVQEFHDHDFPLDMVVMDMDWHKKDNWTGYSWNRKLFPDAPEYLKWLHDQGLHVTLNDHPQGGVGTYENNYAPFMAAMGRNPRLNEVIPYNDGDQRYIENVFKFMHDPLEKMGVDFWWVDWMGDSNFTFDRMDWVNELYFRHSMENGLRGQNFSRWGGWGDHRHPIHFSGDTYITWPTLKFEIPFTVNSGNAGLFYWSHDMGGFQGRRNGELLARWVQFGALSAALRLHSTRNPFLDKRPWTYDRQVEDSMRVSFHLRSRIFPYIYSTAWEATHESLPLLRPLYLENPRAAEAYEFPQEYLFGDIFLVAPITSPGQGPLKVAEEKVWFPEGEWYDWFTGQKYEGGTESEIKKGLESFPLFVKGGIPLPMQDYSERMTTEPLKRLVIRAYPGPVGKEGDFTLYEDDGLTRAYETGRHGTTRLTYERDAASVTLTIGPTEGTYAGQDFARGYDIELPGTPRALIAAINDKATLPVVYDDKSKTNRLTLPPLDIRQRLVLRFLFTK